MNEIVTTIINDNVFNKRHLIATHYSPKTHIVAFYDTTENDISDFSNSNYVVYLIKSGDNFYIGITDCVSRRIQEHIDNKETIIKSSNGTIYYKIIHTADTNSQVKSFEHLIISKMEFRGGEKTINKIK